MVTKLFAHMVIAAAVCASAPLHAQGGAWVLLGTNADQSTVYYDPATVERDNSTVRARIRAAPRPNNELRVRQMLALTELDCARRTTRTITLRADFENGESTDVPVEATQAARINPNSPVAALYEIVCSERTP